jgi:hypothetical protein
MLRWSDPLRTRQRRNRKRFCCRGCKAVVTEGPDWRRRGPAREGRPIEASNSLPGGHSEREPPDPIPNSEVKTLCADGSVAASHARVGHCQAPNRNAPEVFKGSGGVFSWGSGSSAEPQT